MKTLFLEAKHKERFKLGERVKKLPKRVALATTIQYLDSIADIKKEIESAGKKVTLLQGKHSAYKGQMLGCDIMLHKPKDFDAFLFVGDGFFHPKLLLFVHNKTVYVFNPLSNNFQEMQRAEVKEMEKKYKAARTKFLISENIGILVSTKPGQQRLKTALELKKRLMKKEKNAYVFICNTLDFEQLENFNFINCYINTMCPRLGYDDYLRFSKPILNIEDIKDEL